VLTLPARVARHVSRTYGLRVLPPPLDLPPFAVRMISHESNAGDAASRWLRSQVIAGAKALD
jgi:DNA-binding transcriptional LysR family regulator